MEFGRVTWIRSSCDLRDRHCRDKLPTLIPRARSAGVSTTGLMVRSRATARCLEPCSSARRRLGADWSVLRDAPSALLGTSALEQDTQTLEIRLLETLGGLQPPILGSTVSIRRFWRQGSVNRAFGPAKRGLKSTNVDRKSRRFLQPGRQFGP